MNYWAAPGLIITPETLLREICAFTGVTMQDVVSRSRSPLLCDTRHLFCFVAHKKMKVSLNDIGTLIGRDHSTVCHGVLKYDNDNTFKELADNFLANTNSFVSSMFNKEKQWKKGTGHLKKTRT